MSSFSKRRANANKFKWIITFVLIAMLSIAMVFAFVKIDRNETTKTLGTNRFTYAIGLLDSEDGEYVQGTSSIYTKDFYTVDGLTIELEEDATITYKLFFYDEAEEFIEVVDGSEFNSENVPEGAKYFKVEITPTNDVEVSTSEISTYAGQLTVTVNK